MEGDMPIILPNLDDKTFDGLVEEARASIPALYPAWTDHNPSDPGIALIELLAWLTEMVIYRNNRITRDAYTSFLTLLRGADAAGAVAQELTQAPLDQVIRSTVLGLRKRVRATTTADYEELTAHEWPGSAEAGALAAALAASQPPGSVPAIKRILCLGERNLVAASTEVGDTASFRAVVTRNDGSSDDVTATASWGSSAPSVASVSLGVATGLANGVTHITASVGAVSGQATLTVRSGTLVSIALTPELPVAAAGRVFAFTATGVYSDGSTDDITSKATWTSSVHAVLTIDATGRASALAAGASTVTATVGGTSGSTIVTVPSTALVSITITPAVNALAPGNEQQLVAVGHYADTTVADLTAGVTWSSSPPGFVSVSNSPGSNGLMTAVSNGKTTITAAFGAVSTTQATSAKVTVAPAVLVSIAVTPQSPRLPPLAAVALTAHGTYSDGTVADLTAQVVWSSSSPGVASLSGDLATAVATGVAILTAALSGVSGSTQLTVISPSSATLVSIAVTPASPTVINGHSQQMTATATYSDQSTMDLTTIAAFTSTSTSVATVSAYGLAATASPGTTTITASYNGVSGSTLLTVGDAMVTAISVIPRGTPAPAAGHVSLIIAPDSGAGVRPWLSPSHDLSTALAGFFEPRRLLTTHLHVTGPSYVPVTVAATIYLRDGASASRVGASARAALVTRFDPWVGGEDGKGWPFGRHVHASEVYALLARLGGVRYVDSVILAGGAPPSDAEHVVLLPHQLVQLGVTSVLFTLMEHRGTQWAPISQ
jgi:hypothetical protein